MAYIPDLTVIILCYKAEERAYGFVERAVHLIERFVPEWEVILVGNYWEGDRDPTPMIVQKIAAANPRIHAVTVPKPPHGMMGWDARCGLREATGKYICLIDGDAQMPPGDIIRVYKKITKDCLDFVKTYRAVRYDSFLRIVISTVYNLFFKILFPGMDSRDANSKPKIFKREILEAMDLQSNDWFLDAEIMIAARRLDLKMTAIPTKFYKCEYRASFVRPDAIIEFIRNLIHARIQEFRR